MINLFKKEKLKEINKRLYKKEAFADKRLPTIYFKPKELHKKKDILYCRIYLKENDKIIGYNEFPFATVLNNFDKHFKFLKDETD